MNELPPPGPPIRVRPDPYITPVLLPPPLPTKPKLRWPFRYSLVATVGIAFGLWVGQLDPGSTTVRAPDSSLASEPQINSLGPDDLADNYSTTLQTLSTVIPATAVVVTPEGQGTAVLVASNELATNAHVVGDHKMVRIRLTGQVDAVDAEVVGVDLESDLALLRIPNQDVPPIRLADQIRLGEPVIAIGYALDLDGDPTITRGIISATRRTIAAGGQVLANLLQTDTPISSGNSGGPLVNLVGELVGINTAVYRGNDETAATNIGFAIRSDTLTPILERLREGRPRTLGYLGVTAGNRSDGGKGAIVISVENGSPAFVGGLQPDDVVIAVDQQSVSGRDDLVGTIRSYDSGTTVTLKVFRFGQAINIPVTLTTRSN